MILERKGKREGANCKSHMPFAWLVQYNDIIFRIIHVHHSKYGNRFLPFSLSLPWNSIGYYNIIIIIFHHFNGFCPHTYFMTVHVSILCLIRSYFERKTKQRCLNNHKNNDSLFLFSSPVGSFLI